MAHPHSVARHWRPCLAFRHPASWAGDVHVRHLPEGESASSGLRFVGVCLGLRGLALVERIAPLADDEVEFSGFGSACASVTATRPVAGPRPISRILPSWV